MGRRRRGQRVSGSPSAPDGLRSDAGIGDAVCAGEAHMKRSQLLHIPAIGVSAPITKDEKLMPGTLRWRLGITSHRRPIVDEVQEDN